MENGILYEFGFISHERLLSVLIETSKTFLLNTLDYLEV